MSFSNLYLNVWQKIKFNKRTDVNKYKGKLFSPKNHKKDQMEYLDKLNCLSSHTDDRQEMNKFNCPLCTEQFDFGQRGKILSHDL